MAERTIPVDVLPDEADVIVNISEPREVYMLLRRLRESGLLDFRVGRDDYYSLKFRDRA